MVLVYLTKDILLLEEIILVLFRKHAHKPACQPSCVGLHEGKAGDQHGPILNMIILRDFGSSRELIVAIKAKWLADRTLGKDTPL